MIGLNAFRHGPCARRGVLKKKSQERLKRPEAAPGSRRSLGSARPKRPRGEEQPVQQRRRTPGIRRERCKSASGRENRRSGSASGRRLGRKRLSPSVAPSGPTAPRRIHGKREPRAVRPNSLRRSWRNWRIRDGYGTHRQPSRPENSRRAGGERSFCGGGSSSESRMRPRRLGAASVTGCPPIGTNSC